MSCFDEAQVGLKPGLAYQGRAQRQVNESDIYSQSDTETQPKNSGDEENDNIVPMDVETRLSIQHSNEPGLNDEPEDAEIQAVSDTGRSNAAVACHGCIFAGL